MWAAEAACQSPTLQCVSVFTAFKIELLVLTTTKLCGNQEICHAEREHVEVPLVSSVNPLLSRFFHSHLRCCRQLVVPPPARNAPLTLKCSFPLVKCPEVCSPISSPRFLARQSPCCLIYFQTFDHAKVG